MNLPPNPPHAPRLKLATMIALMVLMWAFNFIIGKVGLRHLDGLTLASFRVVLGMALMLAISLGTGWRPDEAARRMPAGRYTGRDALNFFLLGLFGVTMNQVLFTLGLNYTTVAHSALIIGTGPITTLLLASLIRLESLTARKLLGMVLSFAGVGVLAAEHGLSLGSGTLRGDLITLGGSLGFALYTVTAKRVARGYDTVTMNTFNYLAGGLLILPLAVRQAARLDWAAVPWTGWASLFYMAMCASVLAYLIYYWALKHMAASRLVAFGYLTPLLGTLLGIVLLDEPATVHLAAGGALIVTGVYITESRPRRAAGEAEEEENDA